MDGGREKILLCETEGSAGTGSSDSRTCLGWQSNSYRCEYCQNDYTCVSVGVDFDGGGVCEERVGVMSLDLKFDLVLGVCVDVTGEYTYAQERVVATANGVGTVLLETGVSATIDYDVFREAHAEAMRHLDDAGGEAKRWFVAAANGDFAAKRGRSITEQEKPEAYYRFAKDLHTGAAPVAQPDSFNVCEAYPWICFVFGPQGGGGGGGGGGDGGSSCLFEAEIKIPVKVYVESDNLSGATVTVDPPSFTSGTNVPQVTFEGRVQLSGEMFGTIYAGESIAISTTCTTSSCSDPGGEVCVNAGVQVPNFDLPSTEICGRTIGFDDIEVGGIGGEVCICLPEVEFC